MLTFRNRLFKALLLEEDSSLWHRIVPRASRYASTAQAAAGCFRIVMTTSGATEWTSPARRPCKK